MFAVGASVNSIEILVGFLVVGAPTLIIRDYSRKSHCKSSLADEATAVLEIGLMIIKVRARVRMS